MINFIFLPWIWRRFERIDSLETAYVNYCEKYVGPKRNLLTRFVYNEKIDCALYATTCISNRNCSQICAPSKQPYICHPTSLLCLPKNKVKNVRKSNCSPHKGVIAILRGDPELRTTSWECISIFPYLIDNQGNKLPDVCHGIDSKFNINLKAHFPRIEDCVCSTDRKLITFSGRKFGNITSSKDIPRCVRYEYLYVV